MRLLPFKRFGYFCHKFTFFPQMNNLFPFFFTRCSCEVKSKSARKSIQIHSKLIYRSPLFRIPLKLMKTIICPVNIFNICIIHYI